ncbi:MAG: hypothetical protein AB1458_00295 [Bacteroidota bacterium]
MLRILTLILLITAFCLPAEAQKKPKPKPGGSRTQGGFFFRKQRKYDKYFVSLSVGMANASWKSSLGQAELRDKSGVIISSGDLSFSTKNTLNSVAIEAFAPVAKVRLGISIWFEYYFIDRLNINSPAGNYEILFDESFRFEKFSMSCEVPFKYENDAFWSLNAKAQIGYFGFSYVDHFSFFGDEALARTFWGGMGLIGDIKLYPHTYLFLYPNIEYKYYHNNRFEAPTEISHKVFSYGCMAGIRVDVSHE